MFSLPGGIYYTICFLRFYIFLNYLIPSISPYCFHSSIYKCTELFSSRLIKCSISSLRSCFSSFDKTFVGFSLTHAVDHILRIRSIVSVAVIYTISIYVTIIVIWVIPKLSYGNSKFVKFYSSNLMDLKSPKLH